MSVEALLARRLPPRVKRLIRRAELRAARVIYAGSGVTCPLCGRSFRRLAPFKGEPNERCPGCGSLARHRGVYLYLRDELHADSSRRRILHVAPEPALQRWLSALPQTDYVSADLDSPLADVRMDITDIQYGDESFDLIVCSHVLEHVPDDRRAIAELHRVLRSDGDAIIQVPLKGDVTFEDPEVTDPAERARVFGQYDHVRSPGRDYVDRLRAAGFAVEEHDPAAETSDDVVERHALKAGELLYRCRKPGAATPPAQTHSGATAISGE
jgi:SAM-dependent methyltransferase